MVVYALLVGKPGETGLVAFACHDVETALLLLHAEDEVRLGQEGKRSVAVSFGGFRFPHAGNYDFTLRCNDELIAEQTLPVLEAEAI